MNNKKIYVSLGINAINFVAVLICSITTLVRGFSALRMFTVQSNIICGIVALIMVIFAILIILKKKDELPNWLKITKMVTSTAVGLTFFTVALYLGFVAVAEGYSYFIMFKNENIFFHFLTPVLAMISFIFFDGGKKIDFKFTFLNMTHMVLYSIFYITNVFTHLKDGKLDGKYDWYYFVLGENWTIAFVVVGVLLVTYCIGFGLWILNKKFIKDVSLTKE